MLNASDSSFIIFYPWVKTNLQFFIFITFFLQKYYKVSLAVFDMYLEIIMDTKLWALKYHACSLKDVSSFIKKIVKNLYSIIGSRYWCHFLQSFFKKDFYWSFKYCIGGLGPLNE